MSTGRIDRKMKKIGREIGREAARQLRGFPVNEAKRQLVSGWGDEFFKQIFGHSPRPRYRGR